MFGACRFGGETPPGQPPRRQRSVAAMRYSQSVKPIKIIVEKHDDGYVGYPVGMRGVVVGEGDTYDEALADVRSAIRFHIETFGDDAFVDE
jgi:predicted RNase H-like HicB family nuclease